MGDIITITVMFFLGMGLGLNIGANNPEPVKAIFSGLKELAKPQKKTKEVKDGKGKNNNNQSIL